MRSNPASLKKFDIASRRFQTAIDETDKSIDHLKKTKQPWVFFL